MAREKILRSLDASLVILHITTAPRMPTAVQVEESIDQVVNHASYHLEHNVYPEFDPVYRGQMKGMQEMNGIVYRSFVWGRETAWKRVDKQEWSLVAWVVKGFEWLKGQGGNVFGNGDWEKKRRVEVEKRLVNLLKIACAVVAESGVLPRQKRRYAGHSSSYKTTLPVYHRLTEVVNNLALLLETNPLTDTIVLKVQSLNVPEI